jgi:hypothetical protein
MKWDCEKKERGRRSQREEEKWRGKTRKGGRGKNQTKIDYKRVVI